MSCDAVRSAGDRYDNRENHVAWRLLGFSNSSTLSIEAKIPLIKELLGTVCRC